jgi:exosortase
MSLSRQADFSQTRVEGWLRGWPLALGVLVLLSSSYVRFLQQVWSIDEYSHGPIVVAIALFLVWLHRREFLLAEPPTNAFGGYAILGLGLGLYYLGARVGTAFLETLGHILICAGAAWIYGGTRLLKQLRFPLLFLLLAVPIPGGILARATGDLKQLVSAVASSILYFFNYPVARNGVVLTVGQYELFVADACSGLNSIFGLTAIGLLYLHLTGQRPRWQWWTVVLSLLPMAVAANIIRVIVIILLTYYFGDSVGQGFAHELAGLLLFACALGGVMAVDKLAQAFGGHNLVASRADG